MYNQVDKVPKFVNTIQSKVSVLSSLGHYDRAKKMLLIYWLIKQAEQKLF